MTYEAIRCLASCDDAEALDELGTLTVAGDEFLRRMAVEVIGKHPRGRELRQRVLAALRDPSEYVKRTACDVVAQWKWAEAHQLVLILVKEPVASTRESALRALAAIWADSDYALVFSVYRHDPETGVRREAAWTLRQCVGTENWHQVFDALRQDGLPRHRVWACEIAETFGGPDVLPALVSLMNDDDGHVRKSAARTHQTIRARD
jgi:HEAT repeat protein